MEIYQTQPTNIVEMVFAQVSHGMFLTCETADIWRPQMKLTNYNAYMYF